MQIDTTTMENSIEISFKKLGIKLPYDATLTLLGIYPKKNIIGKDTGNPNIHYHTIYNS